MGLVAPRHVGLPRSGIEPMTLALAGGFLTTVPPAKPLNLLSLKNKNHVSRKLVIQKVQSKLLINVLIQSTGEK